MFKNEFNEICTTLVHIEHVREKLLCIILLQVDEFIIKGKLILN